MIALAALYIICVVHAEQYNENSNSGGGGAGSLGNNMDDSGMLGHGNLHLGQLNSTMSSSNKPGSGSQNTLSSNEGHGINNRNMVQWFADLNVDMEEIIEITQEILSLYTIWKDYDEEHVPLMLQALKMPSEPSTPPQQIIQ
ncbi:hypothetical protein FBU30_003403 [Linnemannia zychae]|nr:hypothetical protein FBU30_003403 [Linnemannia zychae]